MSDREEGTTVRSEPQKGVSRRKECSTGRSVPQGVMCHREGGVCHKE